MPRRLLKVKNDPPTYVCRDCKGTCQLGNPDAEKVIEVKGVWAGVTGTAYYWRKVGELEWREPHVWSEEEALAAARDALSP